MRRLTIIITGLLFGLNVYGQQLPVYTQYALNPLVINPAYAGSLDNINLTASYRNQWVNLEGSPETFTFSGHGAITKYNVGTGLIVWKDNIGYTSQTGIYMPYSYKLDLGVGRLYMGLQLGAIQFKSDYSQSNLNGVNDPTFYSNDVNEWKFSTGAGVFWASDNYYVGFSAPTLVSPSYATDVFTYEIRNHYFLTGGYLFELNELFTLKPSAMARMVSGSPVQFDFNLSAYYMERVMAGLQYRTRESWAITSEFIINENIYFGYSFDFYELKREQDVNSGGTHEVILNFFLPLKKGDTPKLRMF